MQTYNSISEWRRFWRNVATAPPVLALTLVASASSALAAGECLFFKDWDYSGERLYMNSGDYISNFESVGFNDVASSVMLAKGCTVEYWFHAGKDGMHWTRTSNVPRFSKSGGGEVDKFMQFGTNTKENDSVSSAYCHCP